MTLSPEAKWPRKDINRKQRRTGNQKNRSLTRYAQAHGADEAQFITDWPQDDTPRKRRKKESGE